MVEKLKVAQSDEFRAWLNSLRDQIVRARIGARIQRAKEGLLGQTRALGSGLEEMKLDFGPGYRLYFARRGSQIVVLLVGGDKSTQSRDIEMARRVLQRWDAGE
jgi:putative addiction module killer protein